MLHDTGNYTSLDVTYPGPRSRLVDKMIAEAAGGERTGWKWGTALGLAVLTVAGANHYGARFARGAS